MNFLRIFFRSFTKSLWNLKKISRPLRYYGKAARIPLDKRSIFVLLYYLSNTNEPVTNRRRSRPICGGEFYRDLTEGTWSVDLPALS